MKKSELRQIIKEEISKVLNEEESLTIPELNSEVIDRINDGWRKIAWGIDGTDYLHELREELQGILDTEKDLPQETQVNWINLKTLFNNEIERFEKIRDLFEEGYFIGDIEEDMERYIEELK